MSVTKCKFEINQASAYAEEMVYAYMDSKEWNVDITSVSDLFNTVFLQVSDLFSMDLDDPNVITFVDNLVNTVRNVAELESESDSVNTDNVLPYLEGVLHGEIKDTKLAPISMVEVPVESLNPSNATDKFLDNAYGTATNILDLAVLDVKTHLFDGCVFNRQLTDIDFEQVNGVAALNRNIRRYQEKLLADILYYVNNYTNKKLDDDLETTLYKVVGGETKATNLWSGRFIDFVNRLFNGKLTSQDLNNLLSSNKEKDKAKLKAYNAWVALSNFDSYIKHIFGDVLKINRFGTKDGSDKYEFRNKTADDIGSWRKDDGKNIDIMKESDKVVLLLIDTTQLVDSAGNPIEGKYLNFNDYAFITSFLKLNVRGEDSDFSSRVFNLYDNTKTLDMSETTKSFCDGKSLAQIINSLRTNFSEIMPMIAELYEYGLLDDVTLIKELSPALKDALRTICYQIFGKRNTRSLYNLTNFKDPNNVFLHVSLTTNSIFKNILTLSYQDENGSIYNRPMLDMSEYVLTLNFKSEINQKNSRKIQPKEEHDFKVKLQENFGYKGANDEKIKFEIPIENSSNNTKFVILTINRKNENVIVEYAEKVRPEDANYGAPIRVNTLTKSDESYLYCENLLKQLSFELLGTDFENEPQFYNNFMLKHEAETLLTKLYSFIGRILHRIYTSNVELRETNSDNQVKEILQKKLGWDENQTRAVKYNLTKKQLNLYGGTESDNEILSELSQSRLSALGIGVSAQINNSEGKALSVLSFSKLLCTYGETMEYWCKSLEAAASELDIVTNPNLMYEVSIDNELYSKLTGVTKDTVTCNPSEFMNMNILLDYLPAVYSGDDNRYTSKGLACFLASVNSDKNTVPKLRINLNEQFVVPTNLNEYGDLDPNRKYTTERISYKSAKPNQILYSIKQNLGKFYSNVLYKIVNDFLKLHDSIETFVNEKYDRYNLNKEEKDTLQKILSEIKSAKSLDYFNNFAKFKEFISRLNALNEKNKSLPLFTERQFIYDITKYYNQAHPYDKVEIVDLTYVSYKGGKIQNNSNTLLALVYRFGYNPSKNRINDRNKQVHNLISEFFRNSNSNGRWSTIGLFFRMRHAELIGGLIEEGVTININSLDSDVNKSKDSKGIVDKIKEDNKDWIDDNGDLIIAKIPLVDDNGKIIYDANGKPAQYMNIRSRSDFKGMEHIRNYLQNFEIDNPGSIKLNPILEKQNLLSYLFTQQWVLSTVGSIIGHPVKYSMTKEVESLRNKANYILEMVEESVLYNAQCKRNVSYTAQMQQFDLNTLYGVNENYNIAVVDDLHKYVDIITSKHEKVTPFDGATIVDPFTMRLENNSLGGSKAIGETKKTFVHFYNPEVGTGGIIKTAVFALTNANMRMSLDFNLNLFYKMSSKIWKDESGNAINWNLLESDLNIGEDGTPKSLFPAGGIYYTKGRKYYWIKNIEYKGDNNYTREEYEVDELGDIVDGAEAQYVDYNDVNSNVKAWELFGGLYSMALNSRTGRLELSETSIETTVNCMNEKGIAKVPNEEIKTQWDFYQPMKHSLTQYVVTEGAIKQGGANFNPNDKYEDLDDLLTQEIQVIQAGTQLDKEHTADMSEVSVPTQVISACAALGYSFKDADSLYEGVSAIAEITLNDLIESANINVNQKLKDLLTQICNEIIIKGLANSSTLSFGSFIAENILYEFKRTQDKNAFLEASGLALSDNSVFNRAINALANYITKNGIKLKMPGTLSVLTPSYKRARIYGDRKLSAYQDPFRDLLDTQRNHYDSHPIYDSGTGFVADVNPEYTYRVLVNQNVDTAFNGLSFIVIYNGDTYKFSIDQINDVPNYKLFDTNRVQKAKTGFEDREAFSLEEAIFELNNDSERSDDLKLRLTYLAIIEKTKKNRPKTRIESDTAEISESGNLIQNRSAYDERMYSEAFDEYRMLQPGLQVYNYTVKLYHTDSNNEISLKELRQLVKDGNCVKITEYIMNGRDLGAYNVRFIGTNGDLSDKYCLWDLDSVQTCWELNGQIEDTNEKLVQKYNTKLKPGENVSALQLEVAQLELRLNELNARYRENQRLMKRDLYNLSKTSSDVQKNWDELGEEINWYLKKGELELAKLRLNQFCALLYDMPIDTTKITSKKLVISAFENLRNRLALYKVRINDGNGEAYDVIVDRSSIKHLDYEIIMPKVFLSTYDLKDNATFGEIKNNQSYFVELNINKFGSNLDSSQFNIEIKNNNGNHYYIAIDNCFNKTGLHDVTSSVNLMIDEMGRIFYLDDKDNPVYEIKPGARIYQNDKGVKVIVLGTKTDEDGNMSIDQDVLDYYLNSLGGSHFNISELTLNSLEGILELIFDSYDNSKWKEKMDKYLNKIDYDSDEDPVEIDSVLKYIEAYNKIPAIRRVDLHRLKTIKKRASRGEKLTDEEKEFINKVESNPLFIDGMEMYNSFIEHGKIIAARIPAQNMQSFMAMQIADFTDGLLNTAYVSDLQIFLQGSDFDIDAVTLLTFDINRQGKLDLWSPYAILDDRNGLDISKTLPLPNNQELSRTSATKTLEVIFSSKITPVVDFFDKYSDLLNFRINKKGGLEFKHHATKIPKFSNNPNLTLANIKSLLEEKSVYLPNDEIKDKVKQKIAKLLKKKLNLKEDPKISNGMLDSIYDLFFKIINDHNLYLKSKYVSNSKLHRIINNSNLYAMYNIITDTANLLQAMSSVDTVADNVKVIANASPKAAKALFNGTGNSFNPGSIIAGNYTGKDCIAKSAATIKTYFKLTHFYNTILNSKDPRLLKLLEIPEDILNACGPFAPQVANIRAVNPLTIVNEKALKRLEKACDENNLDDAAGELSALLGLSADNAKELVLEKINAGIDLIGLYLYGITIGMKIKDLSTLLMSSTTEVLKEAMKGDFFLGRADISINNIFDYFRFGPISVMYKYNKGNKNFVPPVGKGVNFSAYSPMAAIIYILNDGRQYPDKLIKYNGKEKNRIGMIIESMKNNLSLTGKVTNADLAIALKQTLEGLSYNDLTSKEFQWFDSRSASDLNKIFVNEDGNMRNNDLQSAWKFVKQYHDLLHRMDLGNENSENANNFRMLEILSIGSSAMQQIGSIVSLNQGIPNTFEKFLKKIKDVENSVMNIKKLRYKLLNGDNLILSENDKLSLKFRIEDLVFGNEEKKWEIIDSFEQEKVNFNLPALIMLMPDINKYVLSLTSSHLYLKNNSLRYRFIYQYGDSVKNKYGLAKLEDVYKQMSRYVLSRMIIQYFKEISKSGFTFKTKNVFSGGYLNTDSKTELTLGLGSNDELASFKYWMEHEVIPYYQKKYPKNKFFRSISVGARTNTVSGNEELVYTPSINMMPKKGTKADIAFNEVLNAFNNFEGEKYQGHDFRDLMFLYTLYAQEWRPSQRSFMNLFKYASKDGGDSSRLYSKYFNIVSKYDKDANLLELDPDDADMHYFIAAKNAYKNPNAAYIWKYNPDSGLKEMWISEAYEAAQNRRNLDEDYEDIEDFEEEEEDIDESDIGEEFESRKYQVYGYKKLRVPDPDYYVFGDILGSEPVLAYLPTPPDFRVTRSNDKITTITYTKEDGSERLFLRTELEEKKAIKLEDGKEIVNYELLKVEDVESNDDKSCPI